MRLLSMAGRCLEWARRKYIWLFEWYSILRRRKQYRNVKWTKEQQREFDAYWKTNYGKTISNRWHRLYESINGTFDIRYFPEVIFTSRLEPHWNRVDYCKVLRDKGYTYSLYGRLEGVIIPRTYMLFSGRYCYDAEQKVLPREEAMELLRDLGIAILKPTVQHGGGLNVLMVDFQGGVDRLSGKTVEEIVAAYKTNFIVQERVHAHEMFMRIYPKAINTIKILTYILKGKLYHSPISLRVGSGGSYLDNTHAGGLGVGVKDDGRLRQYAYRLGYFNSSEKLERHPDTGFLFKDALLPGVPQIIQAAYKMHGLTPQLGTIAWDFCVNEAGLPVLIEANYKSNGIRCHQVANEGGLFGENTTAILQALKQGCFE